jgi:hypothetical protein
MPMHRGIDAAGSIWIGLLSVMARLLRLVMRSSERRERAYPPTATSSFRHWHRQHLGGARLPRFHRACPSTALDERYVNAGSVTQSAEPGQVRTRGERRRETGDGASRPTPSTSPESRIQSAAPLPEATCACYWEPREPTSSSWVTDRWRGTNPSRR